jgi:hypothetical protein
MAKNYTSHAFPYDPENDSRGMTIRDYFAAKALSGLLAAPDGKFPNLLHRIDYAQNAYALADAMIEAREE